MSSAEITLRVQRVRRRFTWGATASCLAIDSDGHVLPRLPRYAVTFPSGITPVDVVQGQWWHVKGDHEDVEYVIDGYRVKECRVIARQTELLRPSGEHIIQLLATSPAFPGLGEVKARRLWETLGEDLYDCLDHADRTTLAQVTGETLAQVLTSGWTQYANADALRWFQRVGLDLRLSRKIMDVYGCKALETIQADPYRLLAFGMSWSALDMLAQRHFGLPADDERRLIAALEQVLYRAFDAGDTYCERYVLEAVLGRLIGRSLATPLCEAENVLKGRVLYNAQSADYVAIIDAWAAYAGPPAAKPKAVLASHEYLTRIEDPALRFIMQSVISERDKLQAQLNTLKSHSCTTVDRRPLGATVSSNQITGPTFVLEKHAQLTPSERDSLRKAISPKFLNDEGWREGSHGEILNHSDRTLFEVGFANAIRKVLADVVC